MSQMGERFDTPQGRTASKVLVHLSSAWGVQVLLMAAFVAYTAFASRKVPAQSFGTYALALAVANVAAVALAAGLPESAARAHPSTFEQDRALVTLSGAIGLGGATLGLLIVTRLPLGDDMSLLLALFAVSLLWLGPGAVAAAILRREQRIPRYNTLQALGSLCGLVAGLIGVAVAPSAFALTLVPIISGLITSMSCVLAIGSRGLPTRNLTHAATVRWFSAQSLGLNLLVVVTNAMPVWSIGRWAGTSVVGNWNRAVTVARIPIELSVSAISGVTYPLFRRSAEPTTAVRRKWTMAFCALAISVIPVGLACAALIPIGTRFLLGPNWLLSESMVILIWIGAIGFALSWLLGGALQSSGRVRLSLMGQALNIGVLAVGASALAFTGDWLWLGVAYSVSTWSQHVWQLAVCTRARLLAGVTVARWYALALASGLALAAPVVAVRQAMESSPILAVPVTCAVVTIGTVPLVVPALRPRPVRQLLSGSW